LQVKCHFTVTVYSIWNELFPDPLFVLTEKLAGEELSGEDIINNFNFTLGNSPFREIIRGKPVQSFFFGRATCE
jgi:hypothetical protein